MIRNCGLRPDELAGLFLVGVVAAAAGGPDAARASWASRRPCWSSRNCRSRRRAGGTGAGRPGCGPRRPVRLGRARAERLPECRTWAARGRRRPARTDKNQPTSGPAPVVARRASHRRPVSGGAFARAVRPAARAVRPAGAVQPGWPVRPARRGPATPPTTCSPPPPRGRRHRVRPGVGAHGGRRFLVPDRDTPVEFGALESVGVTVPRNRIEPNPEHVHRRRRRLRGVDRQRKVRLAAIEPGSEKKLWEVGAPAEAVDWDGMFAGPDGIVLYSEGVSSSKSESFFVFDPADGKLRWKHQQKPSDVLRFFQAGVLVQSEAARTRSMRWTGAAARWRLGDRPGSSGSTRSTVTLCLLRRRSVAPSTIGGWGRSRSPRRRQAVSSSSTTSRPCG